jgi:hypothetical protein
MYLAINQNYYSINPECKGGARGKREVNYIKMTTIDFSHICVNHIAKSM